MIRIGTSLLFVTAAMATLPGLASAAETIGVVNIRKAVQATKHWPQVVKTLEKKKNELEKGLEEKQEALKKQRKDLVAQRDVLAPKTFREKMVEVQKSYNVLVQEAMRRQQLLSRFEQAMVGQLEARIVEIAKRVGAAKQYEIVVDIGEEGAPNVLYAKKGMEFTEDVLKVYVENFDDKPIQEPQMQGAKR